MIVSLYNCGVGCITYNNYSSFYFEIIISSFNFGHKHVFVDCFIDSYFISLIVYLGSILFFIINNYL